MEFKNENKFFDWLENVLKPEYAELLKCAETRESWLESVENATCNGDYHYEVGSFYTKSKTPESISFDVIEKFILDESVICVYENGELMDGEWNDEFEYVEKEIVF